MEFNLADVLKSISEKTGDNEEVMELLASVQDAFNNLSMSDPPRWADADVMDSDGVRWSEKYDNMRRRYRDRFFSTPEEAKEDQAEDIEKDDSATEETFEALFETREGNYE